ncbi:hypothetical protein, partial [Prevotella histicola]|uniref:hypothetical protein n=1 Tax=Prevotella histicola TaxID=470565 RepID=UPI0028DB376C
ICLTSRGSAVRIRQRPPLILDRDDFVTFVAKFFVFSILHSFLFHIIIGFSCVFTDFIAKFAPY